MKNVSIRETASASINLADNQIFMHGVIEKYKVMKLKSEKVYWII